MNANPERVESALSTTLVDVLVSSHRDNGYHRPHSALAVLRTCLAVEILIVSPLEQWGFYARGAEYGRGLRETYTNKTSNIRYSAPKKGGPTNRVELGGVRQSDERGVHATSAARPHNCQTVP